MYKPMLPFKEMASPLLLRGRVPPSFKAREDVYIYLYIYIRLCVYKRLSPPSPKGEGELHCIALLDLLTSLDFVRFVDFLG